LCWIVSAESPDTWAGVGSRAGLTSREPRNRSSSALVGFRALAPCNQRSRLTSVGGPHESCCHFKTSTPRAPTTSVMMGCMNSGAAPRKCFLISPIGEEGSSVRTRSDLMRRLIVEASLVPEIVDHVERADDHTNPGEITPVIVSAILEADLVVADLTDANPNVYYELAIAHAYGKPTVHIRLTGEILPFDMKDVRVSDLRK